MNQPANRVFLEYIDPLNEQDKNAWVKIEYLGRYIFAAQTLQHTANHLDLGCATGYGLCELAPMCDTLTGLDYDTDALAVAQQRLTHIQQQATLTHADIDNTPLTQVYKAHQFNSITAFEFVEHVNNPYALVQQCHSILQPGGTFLASVPNWRFEKKNEDGSPGNPHHHHIFEEGEFDKILIENKFSIEGVYGQPLCARLPLQERRLLKEKKITMRPSRLPALQTAESIRALTHLFAMPQRENITESYAFVFVCKAL